MVPVTGKCSKPGLSEHQVPGELVGEYPESAHLLSFEGLLFVAP